MGHAVSYEDEGTPREQSRRTFMANTVIALSGVIGVALAIPIVGSLIPDASTLAGSPSPLTADEAKKLQAATAVPTQISFDVKSQDGYLPPGQSQQYVWAIKTDMATMQAKRPDLFDAGGKLPYPVVMMGFTVFSPICPHLGCRYNWNSGAKRFECPCHGSQYSPIGEHLAGPAPRGLDPLPLKEQNGNAQITWIVYEENTPDRIVISYS